jgi:hypothetical protein
VKDRNDALKRDICEPIIITKFLPSAKASVEVGQEVPNLSDSHNACSSSKYAFDFSRRHLAIHGT